MARVDMSELKSFMQGPKTQEGLRCAVELRKRLLLFIRSERKLHDRLHIDGYGSRWQKLLLEDPGQLRDQMEVDIDRGFAALTLVNKEYHRQTGRYIIKGVVGKPKNACTMDEWESYRPEKKAILDSVSEYNEIPSWISEIAE